jgi:DNA-binding Lrp family transcriptional regulator
MREVEIVVLRLLEDDFPLCPRPFLELACRANRGFCRPRTVYFEVIGPGVRRRPVVARHKVKPVSEKDVLGAASSLVRRGNIRRLAGVFGPVDPSPGSLSHRLFQELQAGLPVVAEPYREVAKRLGMSEEALLDNLKALHQTGGLRRIGAVLGSPVRHTEQRGS